MSPPHTIVHCSSGMSSCVSSLLRVCQCSKNTSNRFRCQGFVQCSGHSEYRTHQGCCSNTLTHFVCSVSHAPFNPFPSRVLKWCHLPVLACGPTVYPKLCTQPDWTRSGSGSTSRNSPQCVSIKTDACTGDTCTPAILENDTDIDECEPIGAIRRLGIEDTRSLQKKYHERESRRHYYDGEGVLIYMFLQFEFLRWSSVCLPCRILPFTAWPKFRSSKSVKVNIFTTAATSSSLSFFLLDTCSN